MKISKKVAKGMAIGGAIGFVSSFGTVVYFGTKASELSPIEQKIEELKGSFKECVRTGNEIDCKRLEEQHFLLGYELAIAKQDPAYPQYMENRKDYQLYGRLAGGGLLLSMIVLVASVEAFDRRREEEYWQVNTADRAERARRLMEKDEARLKEYNKEFNARLETANEGIEKKYCQKNLSEKETDKK